MRLILIVLHLHVLRLPASTAWETGPDGRIIAENTPEYVANRYVKKLFSKYGVDLDVSGEIGEKILADLMENLGLGVIHKIPITGENDDDHDDHGHDEHRRRKRSSETPRGVNKFVDSASSIPHSHESILGNENSTDCRSAPLLLEEYNLDGKVTQDAGIAASEFGMLCPALIYLTDAKTCIEHEIVVKERPDTAAVWGYGFLSITVISLLSFLGVAIVPFISASFFETILSVLVAGAVGALCGDALLHLIPHSQATSHSHSKDPVYKNLVVLLGIYLLFIVEGIMKISHQRQKAKKQKSQKRLNLTSNPSTHGSSDDKNDRKDSNDDFVYVGVCDTEKDQTKKEHSSHEREVHGHSHGHEHDHGDIKEKGIASMAWMVIAGDGMHNFSDGVAIGAAFSANIIGGLSTSIAVFCHELPHELGDFAMLVKAGMTVKQALFYNGFAACLGYLGLVLGILIGNYAETVTPWIFAITAGMFLYVALVDMLPEMSSCMTKLKTKSVIAAFLLQNLGLLLGIGIMLLISLFEENIELGG